MQPFSGEQKIRILPEALINKIAAGEVVERPASVVKELVENAIDAGADQVLVTVKNGGKDLISVFDNGAGMSEMDAFHAVERHATSKITCEDDLFNINTLGFRGEALASIAAVSRFELCTCADEKRGAVLLKIAGGLLEEQGKTGFPRGTKITVEQLFFNTPARLKFLKSTATELQHIQQHLVRFALARPSIHFRLTHNQQQLLNLPRGQEMEERIMQLFGNDIRDGLMRVEHEENYLRFQGYVSLPSQVRTSRRWQYLFVNDRHVKCPAVSHGIHDGYRGYLAKNKHPAFFLKLRIDPREIDVNVHPAKTEIRFRNSQLVHTILADQLARQIKETTRRRFFGREHTPRQHVPPSGQVELPIEDPLPLETGMDPAPGKKTRAPLRGDLGKQRSAEKGGQDKVWKMEGPPDERKIKYGNSSELQAIPTPLTDAQSGADEESILFSNIVNLRLLTPVPGIPKQFRVIGQMGNRYIVLEHPEGMALADPHLLHIEMIYRVHAEALRNGKVPKVQCDPPELLQFPPQEAVTIDQHQEALQKAGFEIDSFGGTTFVVRSLPQWLPATVCQDTLRHIVNNLSVFGKRSRIEDVYEDILRGVAFHAALPENIPLSPEQMNLLIAQLEQMDLPLRTLDGKMLRILISHEELRKRFGF